MRQIKRIQGFSPNTLRAYALQLNISGVTLNLLKEYLAKQSDRLKPNSLGYLSVLFDLHMKKPRGQSREKFISPRSAKYG